MVQSMGKQIARKGRTRKLPSLLMVAVGALLAITVFASCGDTEPSPPLPISSIGPVTATPGTPGTQVTATISGMLTFVDPSRYIINIETQSGTVLVLSVHPTARVTVDGAGATLTNLGNRIGSEIAAIYNPANNIATGIEVAG